MANVIGINGFFRALPVDYLVPREQDRHGREGINVSDPRSASVELIDEVELSELGKLLSGMAEAPGIRLGRIARVRTAINAGTYETSAKIAVVVDRLVENLEN